MPAALELGLVEMGLVTPWSRREAGGPPPAHAAPGASPAPSVALLLPEPGQVLELAAPKPAVSSAVTAGAQQLPCTTRPVGQMLMLGGTCMGGEDSAWPDLAAVP